MLGGRVQGFAGVLIWTEPARFEAMARFSRDTLGLTPRSDRADFINFDWSGVRLSVSVHDRVHGELREAAGIFAARTPYSAHDPALLTWVHATLLDMNLRVYELVVAPLCVEDSTPFTSASRPRRHSPEETSWSASAVKSAATAAGSFFSRPSA